MPMENRRVVFTHEELRDTLKNFPGMRENALPEGEITAKQPQRKNNDYFIEFSVLDFSTSKNTTFDAPEKDVASALIEHCIKIKTPLPKKAVKELRIINNSVCLDISIGDLGEGYGVRGVLHEILQKQAELVNEFKLLSGQFLDRDSGEEAETR